MEGNPVPWVGGNRAEAQRRRRRIKDVMDKQAPKPLEGDRRNRAYQLVQTVIAKDIRPALLPRSVMRRNPAGAVGEFMRRENSPQVKDVILTVKRALRAIDPTNDDPDFCNMERFRQEGESPTGASTFMPDATVPGNFAFTTTAKENWPLGEPQVETALAQVQKREAAVKPPRAKRVMTEEQKQRLRDNLAKGREKQAAQRAATTA